MTQKTISKSEFAELAKKMTRHEVAKHYKIGDMVCQRLAEKMGVSFKKRTFEHLRKKSKIKITD